MSIWNTTPERALETAVDGLSIDGFATAADIAAASGVALIEYEEKHFDGPSMGDDEWSSL